MCRHARQRGAAAVGVEVAIIMELLKIIQRVRLPATP
jgi:hypothetical protein